MTAYDSPVAGVAVFVLRRLPALLSLLMLGAHFLRFGQLPLVVVCLGLLVPLFIPRPWARAVVRWALILGAVVWLWTLVEGLRMRLAFGEPWLRLALILGAVALFTGVAAWLLRPEQTETKSSRPFSA